MSGKKKTNTPKKDKRQLEKWTDEELELFIKERRLREITPNLDKQIAIMIEVVDKLEKLLEYPFRDESFGECILEKHLIVGCKDYYSRLIREKERYGEQK